MYFKKIENNQVVGNLIVEDDMRRIDPTLTELTVASLGAIGYGIINRVAAPLNEGISQEYTEAEATTNDKGEWVEQWALTDIVFESTSEQDTYIADQTRDALSEVRGMRDEYLRRTDHYALSDTADMSSAMVAYRQALRDLTDTTADIFNVVFPTAPDNSQD